MDAQQFDVRSIDSIGDKQGSMSISYYPDHGLVSLYATVPNDKRRAGIFVRTNIDSLRKVLDALEREAMTAKKTRAEREAPTSVTQDGATFDVMGESLFVPDDLIDRLKRLIIAGADNHELLKEVRAVFPKLPDNAVSELTHLIYIQFRRRV